MRGKWVFSCFSKLHFLSQGEEKHFPTKLWHASWALAEGLSCDLILSWDSRKRNMEKLKWKILNCCNYVVTSKWHFELLLFLLYLNISKYCFFFDRNRNFHQIFFFFHDFDNCWQTACMSEWLEWPAKSTRWLRSSHFSRLTKAKPLFLITTTNWQWACQRDIISVRN